MRAIFLMGLLLLLGTQAADAWHYRFHYRHWGHIHRYGEPRGAFPLADPGPNTFPTARRSSAEMRVLGRPFPPRDWQLQPVDPQHKGRRYLSPDGAATLVFDASPASSESAAEHLKTVAFVDGEQLLTLVGTQSELLITGTKDHRTFIRKSRLACGGRAWHQVMLEFPTGAQRDYTRIGEQTVRALDLADDDGCAAPTASNEPAGAQAAPQAAAQAPTRPPASDEAPLAAPASPPPAPIR